MENVSDLVPSYVHNHGIMSGVELHQLLLESKVRAQQVAVTKPYMLFDWIIDSNTLDSHASVSGSCL